MKTYEFHPLSNLLPPMEPEEYEAFKADIKAHGLQEPITLYQGKILDGRNRYEAYRKTGLTDDIPVREYLGDDPAEFVVSMNVHRRHLTAERKREAIAALLKVSPTKSDRQVAKTVKVSPTYVGKVRADLEAKGDVSTADTRTDTKGRVQPARKPQKAKPVTAAPSSSPRSRTSQPQQLRPSPSLLSR